MAKGLTSGYQPPGRVGASQAVADAFVGGEAETFVGGITFGAHPVACAVALANLDIHEGEDLVGKRRAPAPTWVSGSPRARNRRRVVSATGASA